MSMKNPRLLISLATLLLCALTLEVSGGPRAILYRGGGDGPVTFNHQLHASKGMRCNDCHKDFNGTGKQLFATHKQGLISFDDHGTEARCFACHDGEVAPVKEAQGSLEAWIHAFDDCSRCHYSKDAKVSAASPGGRITFERARFLAAGVSSTKSDPKGTESRPEVESGAGTKCDGDVFASLQ